MVSFVSNARTRKLYPYGKSHQYRLLMKRTEETGNKKIYNFRCHEYKKKVRPDRDLNPGPLG